MDRRFPIVILLTAICLLALAGVATSAALGTSFTYQGVLSDAGVPASGAFDFRFTLVDAVSGGATVAGPLEIADATVMSGRISVELDFGDVFNGAALWLVVEVRDGASTGAYTMLNPPQELTATPQARHAVTAEVAADADALGGQAPAYYLAWSNISGRPPGLNDGDDDTLGELGCGADQIARWTGSAWSCSEDDDNPFTSIFTVGPVGTGLENGAALLAALDAVPGIRPALLMIEPGSYVLAEGESLQVKWGVNLWGFGGKNHDGPQTIISGVRCGTDAEAAALVVGAASTQLRGLRIENGCADTTMFATGFYNAGNYASLRDVKINMTAAAQRSRAVSNTGDNVVLRDVDLSAQSNTTSAHGVYNTGDDFSIQDGFIAVNGTASMFGIYTDGTAARIIDTTVYANDFGITGQGQHAVMQRLFVFATGGVGIYMDYPAMRIEDSYIWAATTSVQLRNPNSTPQTLNRTTLRNVTMYGSDNGLVVAKYAQALVADVERCTISGETTAVKCQDAVCNIGLSKLSGGAVIEVGTGSATCAGVYDEFFAFYPDTCP